MDVVEIQSAWGLQMLMSCRCFLCEAIRFQMVHIFLDAKNQIIRQQLAFDGICEDYIFGGNLYSGDEVLLLCPCACYDVL